MKFSLVLISAAGITLTLARVLPRDDVVPQPITPTPDPNMPDLTPQTPLPQANPATPPDGVPPSGDAQDARNQCPRVWTEISKDLTSMFVQADGQCTSAARAAVRATFHDCGTWNRAQRNTGGCDGSLILSAEENARPANRGLADISNSLKNLAIQRKVGVADMIAFAGAHATLSCPLGPTVRTFVGRRDSSRAAPDPNLLPSNASLSAPEILSLMADKGFSPPDVAALVGAHSTSRQRFVDPARSGEPQDRTPGIWDVDFYADTTARPDGVLAFQSDRALSRDTSSGPTFRSFVGQQALWNRAFADTFSRLTLLGVQREGLVDCTSALPPPRDKFRGANTPEPKKGGKNDDPGGLLPGVDANQTSSSETSASNQPVAVSTPAAVDPISPT